LKTIRYLVIEGSIGAGKTTMVEALSTSLNVPSMLETFDDNPYLKSFYKGNKESVLEMELHFLIERYFQQRVYFSKASKTALIADYSFEKCLVFASMNLKKNDLAVYRRLYDFLLSQLPRPDLIVYLDVPINRLVFQIGKRGRAMESSMDSRYLTLLKKSYQNQLKQNILVLDGEKFIGQAGKELAAGLLVELEQFGFSFLS
jgi:deoxyguanosine kinase